MNFENKFEGYSYCKKELEVYNIVIGEYREINYGLQFDIEIEHSAQTIRIYESKKNGVKIDLSLVKDAQVKELLNNIIHNTKPSEDNKDHSAGEIELPKSFSVEDIQTLENLKSYLVDKGAKKEKPDLLHKDEVFSVYSVKITFFNSGKILIQGKPSKDCDILYNDMLSIIKKNNEVIFKEKIQEFFEDKEDYSYFFDEVKEKENICINGEEFLGKELFHYLNVNDQITILDAIELYMFAKVRKIKFKNYAIIVRNFAIAFEGFLIKMFIDSNILTEEEYTNDLKTALGTKLSKKEILNFTTNPSRNKDIVINLEYVWQSHRNKNLHSDFVNPKLIDTFEEAEHDVNEVTKAMKTCFEVLDFDKMYINKFAKLDSSESFQVDNVKVDDVLKRLVSDGFSIKQQKKAMWSAQKGNVIIININNSTLKVIGSKAHLEQYINYFDGFKLIPNAQSDIEENAIIGTDESGKGDYFGPLVIAGVHADEGIKKQLKAIGVDDSKKLTDSHIALLASKIKELCKYSIVVIGNQKYNELYDKVGNLNKILAWGHARAIENLLDQVECEIALSDQFGNPELIKNALMSKGKKITLEQRPKAEQNIVVAAASILARNEFVEKLKAISAKYSIEFSKGASPKTIENGKMFIERYGKENLASVAKLHFKTTKEI